MRSRTWMQLGLAAACLAVVALAGPASAEEKKVEEKKVEETVVAWDSLPEAVQQTILTAAGDHEIDEVEAVRGDGDPYYETDWIEGEHEIEIHVAPDGKLLSREVEKAEAEDKADAGDGDHDQDGDQDGGD